MPYNAENYQLKSVYLQRKLANLAESKARSEYMNFSAYVRKLLVEDLKKDDFKLNEELS